MTNRIWQVGDRVQLIRDQAISGPQRGRYGRVGDYGTIVALYSKSGGLCPVCKGTQINAAGSGCGGGNLYVKFERFHGSAGGPGATLDLQWYVHSQSCAPIGCRRRESLR